MTVPLQPRSGLLALASVLLCASAMTACASDGPTDDVLRGRIEEKLAMTRPEATCVLDRLFAELDRDTIARVIDEGPIALPVADVGIYVYAAIDCSIGDELVGATTTQVPR